MKDDRRHPWRAGNRVQLLENGEAYYPRVLEIVNAAEKEIFVETFILFDDPVGKPFQQALIAAARRGCRVELTVDGYGSANLTPEFIGEMTSVGIQFHVYRPQPKVMGMRTNLFRRLHRKLIVVDGRIAFCGGINIAFDHVADFGPTSKQDYAVEVEGPIVRDIHRFVELSVAKSEAKQNRLKRWWQRRKQAIPEPEHASVGSVNAMFVIRDNERHHDDIERQYRLAIKSARSRIVIANAYFFPGWRLLRNLRDAARRGVDVTLILQGKPDMWYVKWVAENLYHYLMKAGVRIYEYCERPLHAKVAVIDDHWATVGSSNLDPLSLYLNLESNLVFRDAAFNAHLASRLRHLMQQCCREVQWDSIPHRDIRRQLFVFITYHLGRRFPAWAGWRPAHAQKQGIAAPDSRPPDDQRETPGSLQAQSAKH
ncbi:MULTISPECIES: cardiolipin synthase ClsB [Hydrocarboniphaga]|jgi:cardiolipin synthase|uniref:cardiolipin synthase ClsB n=1 Tax=Hydrocarboniphaga TaxID=243627 RepID=UPI002ABB93B8|nr:cardiolipin synthase ClsB [Hydrocarboniphaga sp.]MDZ4080248.1 cardiolipin synthase ClsB [Hydrocarboniphaga sp.]